MASLHEPAPVADLAGRLVVVTGGNGGIGYWTCDALARRGATVVLACRSRDRADAAVAALRSRQPHGRFEVLQLDLGNLGQVRVAAEEFGSRFDRLDVLINNAGVAFAPKSTTADGSESHFGTNFLGHFALTGLLLNSLEATPGSRVVQVGSIAQRIGRVRVDDVNFQRRRYRPVIAYSQSKAANVVFMLELDRRLRRTGSPVTSVGAHPGASLTGIADELRILRSPRVKAFAQWLVDKTMNIPELGAEPSVAAATQPGLPGGTYLGPGGRLEIKGAPAPARVTARTASETTGTKLWELAEDLTGIRYLSS